MGIAVLVYRSWGLISWIPILARFSVPYLSFPVSLNILLTLTIVTQPIQHCRGIRVVADTVLFILADTLVRPIPLSQSELDTNVGTGQTGYRPTADCIPRRLQDLIDERYHRHRTRQFAQHQDPSAIYRYQS